MKVKAAVLAGVSSRTITMYNNSVCIDAVPAGDNICVLADEQASHCT